MLAHGQAGLGAGFGFIQNVVLDQHFSERHRLARLLTVVAHNPFLLGVGIDEDTALLVEADGGLEVIGSGTVTILDGRHMDSNAASIAEHACPQMLDVRLHLLPAGARFSSAAPGPLAQFLQTIRPIA